MLDPNRDPKPTIKMRSPEIKWFPGVGELEAWRMDVTVRLITASGMGQLVAGPWARRPFEPDCTFEELVASSSQPLWYQALEETVAETLLHLLHKRQQSRTPLI